VAAKKIYPHEIDGMDLRRYMAAVENRGRDKRKGVQSGEDEKTIYARLTDHRASISAAKNLKLQDFSYRYLPIRALFIPLCESILIETHRPLWNMKLDGFGNKHVGESRKATQQMTKWDLLHPGRPNRAVLGRKGKHKTTADVAKLVREFFAADEERDKPIEVAEMAEAPESLEDSTPESTSSSG
jgi:hypothetical protein